MSWGGGSVSDIYTVFLVWIFSLYLSHDASKQISKITCRGPAPVIIDNGLYTREYLIFQPDHKPKCPRQLVTKMSSTERQGVFKFLLRTPLDLSPMTVCLLVIDIQGPSRMFHLRICGLKSDLALAV